MIIYLFKIPLDTGRTCYIWCMGYHSQSHAEDSVAANNVCGANQCQRWHVCLRTRARSLVGVCACIDLAYQAPAEYVTSHYRQHMPPTFAINCAKLSAFRSSYAETIETASSVVYLARAIVLLYTHKMLLKCLDVERFASKLYPLLATLRMLSASTKQRLYVLFVAVCRSFYTRVE